MAEEKTGENWYLLAGIATGAVAILAGIASLSLMSGRPAPTGTDNVASVQATGAVVEPAPTADDLPSPTVESAPSPATDAPVLAVEAPTFDTVRVETDGSALVAGRAPAGANMSVMIDGEAVATGMANASGSFVAQFALEPSTVPRLMTLEAALPNGSVAPSVDSVAIAPTQAPVAAATIVAKGQPAAQSVDAGAAGADVTVANAPELPAAPSTLLVTDTGASVMQSPTSGTPDAPAGAVSIDTIAYTPGGEVQISGQAAPGAQLRIYLNNADLMTLTAPEAGPWTATLPEVSPGIYTLRVDQVATDGKVTSRFETPFKRETTEALAAATQETTAALGSVANVTPAVPAAGTTAQVPVEADATAPALAGETLQSGETVAAASPAVTPDTLAPQRADAVTVTVQPGFSLWKIARESYGNGVMYVQVFEANKDKIKDPDLIYPGQVFSMPAAP